MVLAKIFDKLPKANQDTMWQEREGEILPPTSTKDSQFHATSQIMIFVELEKFASHIHTPFHWLA